MTSNASSRRLPSRRSEPSPPARKDGAVADVEDDFAGRQQQLEVQIIQVRARLSRAVEGESSGPQQAPTAVRSVRGASSGSIMTSEAPAGGDCAVFFGGNNSKKESSVTWGMAQRKSFYGNRARDALAYPHGPRLLVSHLRPAHL